MALRATFAPSRGETVNEALRRLPQMETATKDSPLQINLMFMLLFKPFLEGPA